MIFGPQRVFVDANVWYSRTLRDWLGMLYTTPDTPPFVVCWSGPSALLSLLAFGLTSSDTCRPR